MKNIVFFISSSIYEFKNERNEIVAFVAGLDRRYGSDHLRIRCEICENVSDEMREEGTQQEYNRIIREESDVVYVLVGNRAGKYTREEFDVAYQTFRKNHARPRVVVYFRRPETAEAPEKSAEAFRKTVFEKMNHYPSEFTHLDTVKLSILLALTREMGLDLTVRDGRALLGGEEVLSTRNVPSFARNQALQELAAERDRLQGEYDEYLELYQMSKKAVLLGHMEEIQQKLQQTTEQLQRMESDALDLLRQAYETRSTGKKVNPREEAALRLLDEGDYEGAKAALRDPEWKKECRQAEEEARLGQLIRDSGLEKIRQYISGQRTLIRTLESSGVSADVGAEIRAIYEEITALAEKYAIELDLFADYAEFLLVYGGRDEGLAMANTFVQLAQKHPEQVREARKTLLSGVQNELSGREDGQSAAEEAKQNVMEIFEALDMEDPVLFPLVVPTFRRLPYRIPIDWESRAIGALTSVAYRLVRGPESERLFQRAIAICRGHMNPADDQCGEYERIFAHVQKNYASLLGLNKRFSEAEEAYRGALQIRRKLAEQNPETEKYSRELAYALDDLAGLLRQTGRRLEAEEFYRERLQISMELANRNPDEWLSRLNAFLPEFASLLYENEKPMEAEKLFQQTKEINDRRADEEGSRARFLDNMASLLKENDNLSKAEETYRELLQIRRKQVKQHPEEPEEYERRLACTLDDLAALLRQSGNDQEAETLIREKIELDRTWTMKNPSRYEAHLANAISFLIALLNQRGATRELEALHRERIELYRRLADRNPNEFRRDLIRSLKGLAWLLSDNGNAQEAENLRREAQELQDGPFHGPNVKQLREGDEGYDLFRQLDDQWKP